jgi:iron-sulfur cluster insertion protein
MSNEDACGAPNETVQEGASFLPSTASDAGEAGSEEQLVSLSPLAAEKVLEILGAERESGNITDQHVLRLRVIGGGCSGFSYDLYFDDQKSEMDRELECNGVKMVVDQMSLMYLVGTEVDYVEGLAGAGFKFHNPNVKSTCGCGSSFQV